MAAYRRRVDTGGMEQVIHHWSFVAAGDSTWCWHTVLCDGTASEKSRRFHSIAAASVNAEIHGFDPFNHYWTATVARRTTHFRPGKSPVSLPTDKAPPP